MLRIKTFFLLSFLSTAFAQTEWDAIRYTQSGMYGTARALGVGNAMSAVGGDMSAANMNPAGLGIYQYSDFTFTPSLQFARNTASFFKKDSSITSTPFTISNLGYVKHSDKSENGTALQGISFALGYNQLERYDREYQVASMNPYSSISQLFADRANGINYNNINGDSLSLAGQGFYTYAIDTLPGNPAGYLAAFPSAGIMQKINLLEEGRKNEWFISLAGNWNDKLYVGGTIGIQNVRFAQDLTVNETDINEKYQYFVYDTASPNAGIPLDVLEYQNIVSTTGNGFNFQLGFIYRPIERLRLGLSIKSPTRLSLTDEFLFGTYTKFDNTPQISAPGLESSLQSGVSYYDYKTIDPYRITAGAMYLFGKNGFVSADVEMKDYSSTKLKADYSITDPSYYDFRIENQRLRSYLKMAVNYRVGAEWRIQQFRVRGGYAFYDSPLRDNVSTYTNPSNPTQVLSYNPDRQVFSAGLGYRGTSLFVDLGWMLQSQVEAFSPYSLDNGFTPTIVSHKKMQNWAITTGFAF